MKSVTSTIGALVCVHARTAIRLLGAATASLLIVSPLFAQLNTGRISGDVIDQKGGAIIGASVMVTDVARGESRPQATDGAGQYSAPNLNPGIYKLRVEFKGYKALEHQNIQIGVGSDVRVDITLQLGEQSQTVTDNKAIPMADTTNAQTGGDLDNQSLSELPINGRNYRWKIATVPGVLLLPGEGTASEFVNGAPGEAPLNVMVDGQHDESWFGREINAGGASEAGNTTLLPLDAVQEVNVVVNPKAEYGWVPGATVNVGLKSGTNDIHGSAYAFGRDAGLDARNPFAFTSTGQPLKAPLTYEQFGATLGGPAKIKKHKFFYFLGYEGIREDLSSATDVPGVPTTADLGSSTNQTSLSFPDAIYDIIANHGGTGALNNLSLNLAGCNYPEIVANAAAIKAGSSATVAPYCTANQYGASSLWGLSGTRTTAGLEIPDIGGSNNGVAKVDYRINDHHTMNGSAFIGQYNELAAGNSPSSILENYWEELLGVLGQDYRVAEVWTPNSSWLNEATIGWNHSNRPVARAECAANGNLSNPAGIGASTGGYGGPNYLTQYGMDQNAPGCGIPTITINGLGGQLGFSNGRVDRDSDLQFADSVSNSRGNHQFKAGVDARFESFSGANVLASQTGAIAFGTTGDAAFGGATPLESFLAGDAASETIRSGSPIRSLTASAFGVFGQDDWRIFPRLTFNIGFRGEIVTPPTDSANAPMGLGDFDSSQPSGMDPINRTWANQLTFDPRLGVAWDVRGNGTTTVRAGGGVSNDFEELMDFVSGGGTGNYDSVPTGAKLVNANGTSTITAPGRATSSFVTTTASSAENPSGIVSFEPIPWNVSPTPLWPSPIPVACGNGLPREGIGTTVSALNPLNPAPCSAGGGDPNLKYYHYVFWNVNVQHAFTNNLSLDAGYVGSRSWDIIQSVNLNQATPTNNALENNPASEQFRATYEVQFPWFSTITYDTNSGVASYNAFQLALVQRASHGLIFSADYTFARAFESSAPLNVRSSPQQQYGPTPFDVRQHVSFTATYQIPGVKMPGQMLEGWELNTAVNFVTAFPVTISDSKDDLTGAGPTPWTLYGSPTPFNKILGRAGTMPCYGVTGVTTSSLRGSPCSEVPAGAATAPWANLPAACIAGATNEASYIPALAGTTVSGSSLEQLALVGCYMVNGSAIVPPAQGTYGTMTPGELRGPGSSLVDASVTKSWKIKERYTAQLRLEVFNLLNHTQYAGGGLTGNAGATGNNPGIPASFGLATSTPDVAHGEAVTGSGGPREMQLGLKILF